MSWGQLKIPVPASQFLSHCKPCEVQFNNSLRPNLEIHFSAVCPDTLSCSCSLSHCSLGPGVCCSPSHSGKQHSGKQHSGKWLAALLTQSNESQHVLSLALITFLWADREGSPCDKLNALNHRACLLRFDYINHSWR